MVGPAGLEERLQPPRVPAAFRSGFASRTPPGAIQPTGTAAPAVAYRMVPGSNGRAMMVHQRGVEEEVGTQPNAYGGRQNCSGVVEAAITAFEPGDDGRHLARSGGALASTVLPVDLALSPDGRQVAVVSAGHAGTRQQLTFFASEQTTAPPRPEMPCISGSPDPMPGLGTMPTPPGRYDAGSHRLPGAQRAGGRGGVRSRGNIVQSREPATLQILTQRVAPIVLSYESRADPGHRLFHDATPGKLACASCHPEGGEDGRVWRFVGQGSRRTQSLRGGIMDTAPFHWSGDQPTLDHLMADVFQGRMGGAAVERSQVTALGRWLEQVPTIAPSRPTDTAAVERGRALFDSPTLACATCHRGTDLAIAGNFDVGTGGAFQVPPLHNVGFRAPFLHDGCATTLVERFTRCGGGDKHGLTSRLSSAEIDDLVAYLENL